MNIKNITHLLSGLLLFLLFPSCGDNDTTTNYSSGSKDAQIYSFGISAPIPTSADYAQRVQDTIRFKQVNNTKFAIDQVGGVIYNPDSLMYGTVLSKVKITITFNPTASPTKVVITTPDSIKGYSWNLTDSVYLGKLPVTFTITASDGITSKPYNINIRTHKIDPDTIIWQQMSTYPAAIGQSKTILKGSVFYTYGLNSGNPVLYTSDKSSINWAKQTLSGFATTMKPESIFLMNDIFYALDQAGNAHRSENGMAWTKITNGKTLTSLLGVLPAILRIEDQLLVIYKDVDNKYYFGKTKDLITITPTGTEVPANFPLQKAASFTNMSLNPNKRMLILTGGISATGTELGSTWLVRSSGDELEMSPFTKNTFFKGAGLSNFIYNENLYALNRNQFYISPFSGEAWAVAPNKQMFDLRIDIRTGQTVIVDESNYIWILGGVLQSTTLSDVWRGRLNSLIP